MDKLTELKCRLYSQLLLKGEEQTDAEINIGYELSKDPDIQEVLQKGLKKEWLHPQSTRSA